MVIRAIASRCEGTVWDEGFFSCRLRRALNVIWNAQGDLHGEPVSSRASCRLAWSLAW